MAEGSLSSNNLNATNQALNSIHDSMDRSVRLSAQDLENRQRALELTQEMNEEQAKLPEKMKKAFELGRKQEKAQTMAYKRMNQILEHLPEHFEEASKAVSVLTAKVEKELNKSLAETAESINKALEANQDPGDLIFSEKDKRLTLNRLKEIHREINKLDDRTFGKGLASKLQMAKGIGGSLKTGWKDRTGEGWRTAGGILKEKGASMAAQGGMRGAAGSAMGMMGGAVGGMSKFVPVVGQIVAGLSMLNDVVNAADGIVKKSREDYASLAGAQFNGEGFAANSKRYNKETRDVRRNMDLGVASAEWNNMYRSMNAAGMTFDATEVKLGDMGKVMETVRRTSLTLGVSLDIGGEMFAKQAQDLHEGMGSVQGGLIDVAKGAKVAGIETNKFYQNVLQSTLALANYGNFTKQAAAAQKKAMMNSGMTQEQGAKMAGTLMTNVVELSDTDAMNMAGVLTGKVDPAKMYDDIMKSINSKLADKTISTEEREKYLGRKNTMENLSKEDGPMTIGKIMKSAGPEMVPEFIMKAIKTLDGVTGNLSDAIDKGTMSYQDLKAVGVNMTPEELKRMLEGSIGGASDTFAALNKQISAIGNMEAGSDKNAAIMQLKNMQEIMSQGSSASEEDITSVLDYLQGQGVSRENAKRLMSKDASVVGDMLSGAIAQLSKGKKSGISVRDYADKSFLKSTTTGTGFEIGTTIKGQDDMIEALTPLEKLTGIAKESAVFALSDSAALQSMVGISAKIREGVFGLLEFFTREKGGDSVVKARSFVKKNQVAVDNRNAMTAVVENQDKIDEKLASLKDNPEMQQKQMEKYRKDQAAAFDKAFEGYLKAAGGDVEKEAKLKEARKKALATGGPVSEMARTFIAEMDKGGVGSTASSIHYTKEALKKIDEVLATADEEGMADANKQALMGESQNLRMQLFELEKAPTVSKKDQEVVDAFNEGKRKKATQYDFLRGGSGSAPSGGSSNVVNLNQTINQDGSSSLKANSQRTNHSAVTGSQEE